ncbi:MAG: hypothetical protein AB3N21_15200 [Ruegeria sp.]|uniref:hypothetical protein n=1 Tax=Ruegeria sp. TaxID=1879320 RepID=UPI00349EA555
MQDEILAVVEASAPRRWIGVGMLVTVGVLVIYVALATPPALGWQVFLIVMGILALWLAQRMYQATAYRIELTTTELRSSAGVVIAQVTDVEAMDRGVFAFKPSNGFLLRTRTAGEGTWAPGLWWRLGRRIGVGGVTAAAQTKFMSETLAALMAERDGV